MNLFSYANQNIFTLWKEILCCQCRFKNKDIFQNLLFWGSWKISFILNLGGLKIRGEDRFCKFFFSHALLLDIVHSISYSSLQQSSSHPNRLSWLKIQSTNDGVVSSRGRRQIIIYCQTSSFSCGLNKNKLIKCFIIR